MSGSIKVETSLEGDRPVVVKSALDGQGADQLAREADRLERGRHRGVVELLHADPERLVLAWAGQQTFALVRPDPREAAALLAAVAATVADLHEVGLIHGRLTPDHVLVGGDGRPRVGGLRGCGPAEPQALPTDDVADVGRLIDHLLSSGLELEPIPDRRWGRRRTGSTDRRALLAIADRATQEDPAQRPTARSLALMIADAVPGARLSPPPSWTPATPSLAADLGGPAPVPQAFRPAPPWAVDHPLPGQRRPEDVPLAAGEEVAGDQEPTVVPAGGDHQQDIAVEAAPDDRTDRDVEGAPDEACSVGGEGAACDHAHVLTADVLPAPGAPMASAHPAPAAPPWPSGADEASIGATARSGAGAPDPARTASSPEAGTEAEVPPSPFDPAPPTPFGPAPSATFLGMRIEPGDDRPAPGGGGAGLPLRTGDRHPAPQHGRRPRRQPRPAPSPSVSGRRSRLLVGAAAVAIAVVALGWWISGQEEGDRLRPASAEPSPTSAEVTTSTSLSPCVAVAAPAADVDGDGCAERFHIAGTTIEVDGERWALGQPGDHLSLGDWDCDGRATPGLVRPSTGEVFLFARWPDGSGSLTARPVLTRAHATALVTTDEDRCRAPALRLDDGRTVAIDVPSDR
ncbi:hypothetical protein KSP35_06275 [Aquihabitans sp. G128]|uniref:hypothetical protein n=1 Tax=Aquihabitans sp. G128 TaxID=2849779 RepID=UPI001C21DC1D|nr:hypothetical protein [Aquihabitans sp. G128]QXC62403.1 hypothetical protein KSP35_06275 [Aquihabitans sp. G128]